MELPAHPNGAAPAQTLIAAIIKDVAVEGRVYVHTGINFCHIV
jgi:hypothetical protein